jgi:Fic family protein
MGHFGFGFIHPYRDGNGRVSRFVMNAALVADGHPWTVIQMANRADYLKTLEAASVGEDIEPFVRFVRKEMDASRKPPLPEVTRVPVLNFAVDPGKVDERSII